MIEEQPTGYSIVSRKSSIRRTTSDGPAKRYDALDANDHAQEFVLEAQTERVLENTAHASKCLETLREVLRAYDIDMQFSSER